MNLNWIYKTFKFIMPVIIILIFLTLFSHSGVRLINDIRNHANDTALYWDFILTGFPIVFLLIQLHLFFHNK